jgi:hypothetical protein
MFTSLSTRPPAPCGNCSGHSSATWLHSTQIPGANGVQRLRFEYLVREMSCSSQTELCSRFQSLSAVSSPLALAPPVACGRSSCQSASSRERCAGSMSAWVRLLKVNLEHTSTSPPAQSGRAIFPMAPELRQQLVPGNSLSLAPAGSPPIATIMAG